MRSHLAEERIAATLNVDVAAIRRRVQMLEGICPEVVEMLRDKKLSLDLFPVLRKMKAIGQIATVELMVLRNDYSVAFAKTRLAISPPALLAKASTKRQEKANARYGVKEPVDCIPLPSEGIPVKKLQIKTQGSPVDIATLKR